VLLQGSLEGFHVALPKKPHAVAGFDRWQAALPFIPAHGLRAPIFATDCTVIRISAILFNPSVLSLHLVSQYKLRYGHFKKCAGRSFDEETHNDRELTKSSNCNGFFK
jgi:hypothetical protein